MLGERPRRHVRRRRSGSGWKGVGDEDDPALGHRGPPCRSSCRRRSTTSRSWNDAVAAGAWTRLFQGIRRAGAPRPSTSSIRGAFPHSFEQMVELIRAAGAGERGDPPSSILTLGGDIHHAYLARVDFPEADSVTSPVWQAVCSPFRNALSKRERRVARAGDTRLARTLTRGLARSAGVKLPEVEWRLKQEPTFDNQFATLTSTGTRSPSGSRGRFRGTGAARKSRPRWSGPSPSPALRRSHRRWRRGSGPGCPPCHRGPARPPAPR